MTSIIIKTLSVIWTLIIFGLSTSPFSADYVKKDSLNIYESKLYYDYDNKIMKHDYYNYGFYEVVDYKEHIKYKVCGETCEAGRFYEDMPYYYKKSGETNPVVRTDKHTYYFNNDNVNKITYDNISISITNINPMNSLLFNPKEFNCPEPVCSVIMDLVIVIDESGSILNKEFDIIRSFINSIVDSYELGADKIQIGVVGFAEKSKIISKLSYNKNNIKTKVNAIDQAKGNTCIQCGLETARIMLENIPKARKNLNPTQVIILMSDGEANKPVKNDSNYYKNTNCYSYDCPLDICKTIDGHLSRSCKDMCNTETARKKNFDNPSQVYYNNNKCYRKVNNKSSYAKIKTSVYPNNSICYNNKLYPTECCASRISDFCCNTKYIGTCEGGTYITDSISKETKKITDAGIKTVGIAVRDASINQFKEFTLNIYYIKNFKELKTIIDGLTSEICKMNDYNDGCKNCNGICKCKGICECPVCDNKGSCFRESCKVIEGQTAGCKSEEIQCLYNGECYDLIRNNSDDMCCKYNNVNCEESDKCYTYGCSYYSGCYKQKVDCNSSNGCIIDSCDPDVGCVHTPVECGENEICIPTGPNPGDYECKTSCDGVSSCGEDNACGSWDCINGKCRFVTNCDYNIKCKIYKGCELNISDNSAICKYEDVTCDYIDECTESYCDVNTGYCTYYNKTCETDLFCKETVCDPEKGCILKDKNIEQDEPCVVKTCNEDYKRIDREYLCVSNNKCDISRCNIILNECEIIEETCDNYTDSRNCYIYYCDREEQKCKKEMMNITDKCHECLSIYYLEGFIDNEPEECVVLGLTSKEFTIGISGIAIVGIVIAAIIGVAIISIQGTKMTKDLINRSKQAAIDNVTNNPFYKSKEKEFNNIIYEGNNY